MEGVRIERVTYRRLRNLGGYENDAVEATAAVERGEMPEQALMKLAEWVHDRLGLSLDQVRALERRGRELKEEIGQLEDTIGILQGNWEVVRQRSAEKGLDVDALVAELRLPF